MEDADAREEATFRWTVKNVKNLKDAVLSPPFFVRNLPWKIMVTPRQPKSSEKQQRKSLAFFLQCNTEDNSSGWSCYATAELRLIPQKPDTEPFTRKIQHLFYSKEDDWGYSSFMAWDDVLNPNKGYIKNNTIILEVFCAAEMPNGVSSVPKKRTECLGDSEITKTDKTTDNILENASNCEDEKNEAVEIDETTSSDNNTEAQGSSSESKSKLTQGTEITTTEETLVPGSHTTVSGHQSTEQQRIIDDDNSIINVLQRVENILSSLLNTTQQQNSEMDKDEFYYFALSVAVQLRKLPTHIAVDTQNKIQSTLSTARLTSMISNTSASSSSLT